MGQSSVAFMSGTGVKKVGSEAPSSSDHVGLVVQLALLLPDVQGLGHQTCAIENYPRLIWGWALTLLSEAQKNRLCIL